MQGPWCLPYASVGIPARMVGGYQGGQINPVTGHVVVRQFQAHAWVEVWLQGQGWTRVDPTGAVAPARVESGLNAALSNEDRASLSFLSSALMAQEGALASALQWMDSLEYRWNLWVIGYDTTVQLSVLKRLLGELTPTRLGFAMLAGGVVSLAFVAMALFWRRRPKQRNAVERVFIGFCAKMARQGLSKEAGETPKQYLDRLTGKATGNADTSESVLAQRVQAHLYNPSLQPSVHDLRWLRQELRKLRFRLAFVTPG